MRFAAVFYAQYSEHTLKKPEQHLFNAFPALLLV